MSEKLINLSLVLLAFPNEERWLRFGLYGPHLGGRFAGGRWIRVTVIFTCDPDKTKIEYDIASISLTLGLSWRREWSFSKGKSLNDSSEADHV